MTIQRRAFLKATGAAAAIAFAAVEFEKWIRFGGRRDKNEMPS